MIMVRVSPDFGVQVFQEMKRPHQKLLTMDSLRNSGQYTLTYPFINLTPVNPIYKLNNFGTWVFIVP